MKLLSEAAARKLEREHNERAWLAWHIAALQRSKKLAKLKDMQINATTSKRQTWREQWKLMEEWSETRRKNKERLEKLNG